MNREEIYEIIERFETSDLSSLSIKDRDFSIEMVRGSKQSVTISQKSETAEPQEPVMKAIPVHSVSKLTQVKAPLVGTYYAAPDPESSPFVEIGQQVVKGQTLCIIESMKMLNELKSPVSGKIAGIYGSNGELAEFDQLLFEVEEC